MFFQPSSPLIMAELLCVCSCDNHAAAATKSSEEPGDAAVKTGKRLSPRLRSLMIL